LVRHVGLTESIAMIADALGWPLDRITDDVQPKLATVTISSEFLAVDPGYVSGIIQDGVGYRKGQAVIRLHLEAYLGAPDSYDTVDIEGSPRVSMKIPGGIPGDLATASIVVNSIPKVPAAAPGLHTMRDLPLPFVLSGKVGNPIQGSSGSSFRSTRCDCCRPRRSPASSSCRRTPCGRWSGR
jgi:4-hydroxy-tetrahydrodipicolinate reductase